ncbi:MAG TPA: hypothetical protein VGR21_07790 [Cryptosporangiaceae bacterium]|nr:hypothetical protein [Cryptosporangiaceae bacterium]
MTEVSSTDDAPTEAVPILTSAGGLPAVLSALTAAVATVALAVGTAWDTGPYAAVVLALQLALVATWCFVARPPAVWTVVVVAVVTAAGADAVASWASPAAVGPLGLVVAGSFGLTIFAQLARGIARRNVTEAFGVSMLLAVAVTSLATTISLHRQDGIPLLLAVMLAAGIGVTAAHVTDLFVPQPVVHEVVARGVPGLVVGGVTGGVVAALVAALSDPLSVPLAAVVGLVVGTTAVLSDLGVAYAAAGRALATGERRPHLLTCVLGPLFALPVAAPVGYVFGLVLLN